METSLDLSHLFCLSLTHRNAKEAELMPPSIDVLWIKEEAEV
jgi:hypothetical protein